MDIVLNTVFNNPNLPKIPIYGFNDDFNRSAADTLGSTAEGKPWVTLDAGSAVGTWGTTGNGTAKMKSAASQTHTAVVDALASDGQLVAKLARFDADLTGNRYGLAVRFQDMQNYIVLETTKGVPQLTLRKYVGGTSSTVQASTLYPAPGDTITVELDGTTVTVLLNGATALTATVPEFTTQTRHGMFAFAGSDAEWDSVQFVAA